MQNIKQFYHRYIMPDDRLILALAIVTFLIGMVYIVINKLIMQYTGILYVPNYFIYLAPIFIGLTFLSFYAREHSPLMASITRTYGLYYCIVVALGVLTTGIQYTPFPLIDHHLARIDAFFGYNSVAVLNWTYNHPHFKTFLEYAYDAIGPELFIIPLFLGVMKDRRSVNIYFYAIIFSYLIGTTIYYFLPTAGLTVVFSDPHFMKLEHDTYLKFMEVHLREVITTYQGGMIAFPSFHVIWSILVAHALIRHKYVFYPVAIFNIFVIASTMLLGWHYMTDVIGGFVVAGICISLATYIQNRMPNIK